MVKRTKEELIDNIVKILADLFDRNYVDRWIESKDRPITSLIKKHEMEANYSCAIIEELKNKSLLESSSRGKYMCYKVSGFTIPDLHSLAEKIYENYRNRKRSQNEFDGYKNSDPKDLSPKRIKKSKEIDESSDPVLWKKKEYKLLDRCYILHNDCIFEGVIIGMYFDGAKIKYDVNINNNVIGTYRIFCTIEGVLNYMSKNVVKFEKNEDANNTGIRKDMGYFCTTRPNELAH